MVHTGVRVKRIVVFEVPEHEIGAKRTHPKPPARLQRPGHTVEYGIVAGAIFGSTYKTKPALAQRDYGIKLGTER